MKNKRKRIEAKASIGEAVVDIEGFIENRCSNYAKRILTSLESIAIEIYFDKHYFIRMEHGDSNGKRIGIDFEDVLKLVIEASGHLFLHSSKVKAFSFINFETIGKQDRMVLTKVFELEEKLNVIVEYHYISLGKYEATLITAMRKEDFYFSDGSFQLEIQQDGSSSLYKSERGKIKLVCEFVNI